MYIVDVNHLPYLTRFSAIGIGIGILMFARYYVVRTAVQKSKIARHPNNNSPVSVPQ